MVRVCWSAAEGLHMRVQSVEESRTHLMMVLLTVCRKIVCVLSLETTCILI